MVQPLDPSHPVLPPRAPLRHRRPGQRPRVEHDEHDEHEEKNDHPPGGTADSELSDLPDHEQQQPATSSDQSQEPDGNKGLLVDDYA